MTDGDDLLFRCRYRDGLDADVAAGGRSAVVPPGAQTPVLARAAGRAGARFGRDGCLHYPVASNLRRESGTVMLWFRPDWAWDWADGPGRILWDLRIDHGSVVPDDPSQRYALVYPSVAGRGGTRRDDTFGCWRLCLATNRNRYVIGTDRERPDKRTRQAVFGAPQRFAAGTWMHLAVTWNPRQGAIFVDGVEDGRADLSEGLPDRPFPAAMQVGAVSSWINAGPQGVIADLRIYGRDLDAARVTACHREGEPA